jgi:hypothetical protein
MGLFLVISISLFQANFIPRINHEYFQGLAGAEYPFGKRSVKIVDKDLLQLAGTGCVLTDGTAKP